MPPLAMNRFSSRRARLDRSFLTPRLQGAQAYDRIAGYFSSSILEVAGEALETVSGPIRMVCNAGLQESDVREARAALAALRQVWCEGRPEEEVDRRGEPARERLSRLADFLRSGKLSVKVLPNEALGLLHGKAGVITLADGQKTSFLGSVNETISGWRLNYELLWEDPSAEAVAWVEEEFEALWTHPMAVNLSDVRFIIQDLERLTRRQVLVDLGEWTNQAPNESPSPAPVFVESPVMRQNVGLWEHQKYFVKLAFDAHCTQPGGARFVLADQVGLGKTVQLAMAAELMALVGERPVLILAPKTLLAQWQNELWDLLDLPSAIWDGKRWIDEQGIEYPAIGPGGIRQCPRRLGIVSTGLISACTEVAEILQGMRFECVILDEAHRARRSNLAEGKEGETPDPNNLLAFLYEISSQTKSMLLATATPVQLHAVEAWDLLDALNRGSETVLGNTWSRWRNAKEALGLVMGTLPRPTDDLSQWEWLRTPFPPAGEHKDFQLLRQALALSPDEVNVEASRFASLKASDRARLQELFPQLAEKHNPFIRHIIRRSRHYLETTLDPTTGEPFLQPIAVELFGENDDESIHLPYYLESAYRIAERFCQLLGQRMQNSGFLKTLLLRRVGSTIAAGRATAEKLLNTWDPIDDPEEDPEEFERDTRGTAESESRTLTQAERALLKQFTQELETNQERDPKYHRILDLLANGGWLQRGCIIFSQYFDSLYWLGSQLISDFPQVRIGLYAGSGRSGLWEGGRFHSIDRDRLKAMVKSGELRLLLGTDAASEGLNLQQLGALINLDLPWNPTRLEQRKGRIQRIGQIFPEVWVYNLRYEGSVEDRVHQLLSDRLKEIHTLFGQLPDVLEDVWIDIAMGEQDAAKKKIDATPKKHPFEERYKQVVEPVDWETCAQVLSKEMKAKRLTTPW